MRVVSRVWWIWWWWVGVRGEMCMEWLDRDEERFKVVDWSVWYSYVGVEFSIREGDKFWLFCIFCNKGYVNIEVVWVDNLLIMWMLMVLLLKFILCLIVMVDDVWRNGGRLESGEWISGGRVG